MEEVTAFCGIICNNCPAFIATVNDDIEHKKEIADSWSSDDKLLEPEDVECEGCIVGDYKLMKLCNNCDIRPCVLEKNIKNCAYCYDYPCERLDKIFKLSPQPKETLEEIRKGLKRDLEGN